MEEYIAIYDVRGIQKYIFATNELKEIIGASKKVENILNTSFKESLEECGLEKSEYILIDDLTEELKFNKDKSIKVETLYYGGGNLVVLYRNKELLEKVSLSMANKILNEARGLSLVYAYTSKTDNYSEDLKKLYENLEHVKDVTPPSNTKGIIPIVLYDSVTGQPLSEKDDNNRKITYASSQKLKEYKIEKDSNTPYMLQLDDMRTNENEGLIAIVHIDGNSMGANIKEIMSDEKNYEEAAMKIRKISKNIHNTFEEKALETVIEKIKTEIAPAHEITIKNKLPFRPIIQAGDDITFVCNARLALDIVKEYINSIRNNYMYNEKFPFSACAGIAIIHSHYPFYKGYQLAEECCQSAKKRAKNEGKINNSIGNFVDFEYCYTNNTSNLETIRENNYKNIEGLYLLKRPYGIYDTKEKSMLNDIQKVFDIDDLYDNLKLFNSINVSRTTFKMLRDKYYNSEAEINYQLSRQNTKNKTNFKDAFIEINNTKCATYFDALELEDLFKAQGGQND